MDRQERIVRRSRRRNLFFSPIGTPVSCEIYVETDDDGLPEILSSVEVEGMGGNRILSQSEVDETEVLLIYRQWRRRPENQGLIRRVYSEDLRPPHRENGHRKDNEQTI